MFLRLGVTSVEWLLQSRKRRPSRLHGPCFFRPSVEPFEDRLLLSTFLVTTTDDSGPGSFRQAILDANAEPGSNKIAFDIGQGGAQTIRPASALPTVTRPVVIDGTTQPGFTGTPLIELSGSRLGFVSALTISAGHSVIRGFVINSFHGNGIELRTQGGNLIAGNFIGTDISGENALGNGGAGVFVEASNNTIGGTTAQARNVIAGNSSDGVWIFSGSNNLVQGNYIGTDVSGSKALGNAFGVVIFGAFAANNTIGGPSGVGNVISGNQVEGVALGGNDNLVQGNFVGTDASGTCSLGNYVGIVISGSYNRIGGRQAGTGNLVSGNVDQGVAILSLGTGNIVQGNAIGTSAYGDPLGNGSDGLDIFLGSDNIIGGTAAGAANTIAYNGGHGVTVYAGVRNAIRRNAIFANGDTGIALIDGGNNMQPAPQLTSATSDGGILTIRGTLTAAPGTTFTLEFFGGASCGPGHSGQAERFLGSMTVTTDSAGQASFELSLALPVDVGDFITATATDPDNNTSAFSRATQVVEAG
jgi:hypothetical protein